jgi:hypothetical protein
MSSPELEQAASDPVVVDPPIDDPSKAGQH